LIGQLRLGFPVVGQMQDLQAVQLERVTPASFLVGQAMLLGPAVLLALAGRAQGAIRRSGSFLGRLRRAGPPRRWIRSSSDPCQGHVRISG
jgi:hypothetical protein